MGAVVHAGDVIGSSDPDAPRPEDPKFWVALVPEDGFTCSQPLCRAPAVMLLLRPVRRRGVEGVRRWGCCSARDHSYGRVNDGGQVWWDPQGRRAGA